MFPFNTDGIDPAGTNIWIHDCEIENYDDAVAVKPSSSKYIIPCTTNVLVENIKVKYGVGMSIGRYVPSLLLRSLCFAFSCLASHAFQF